MINSPTRAMRSGLFSVCNNTEKTMLIELKGMGSKALQAKKESILKACKQHGITSVCIVYCGGVNSGLTDFISVEPAIDKEALEQIKPIGKTRRFDAASYSIVLEDQEVTLHQ